MSMAGDTATMPSERELISRFRRAAAGFWTGRRALTVWALSVLLIAIVLAQLIVQYRLNFWNRDFFNALADRDGAGLWNQALLFVPLAACNVTLAIASVWGRMTMQRKWRAWLTRHVITYWLAGDRYRRVHLVSGHHQNPEYRIAEDARIATDAPIDLAVGLLTALLSAVTFISVLWRVGDSLAVTLYGWSFVLPGYLVIAVVVYAAVTTGAMVVIGRRLTHVVEGRNQAEAELIAAGARLRAAGEGDAAWDAGHDRAALAAALKHVLERWRELCWQLMGTTLVSQGNLLLAPVVAWILCAPKYLAGTMELGELTQAAAAFVLVQTAFNWFLDNYQRLADWASAAHRVAALLLALDQLEGLTEDEPEETWGDGI
ncbi:MAG TPA: SbmA/BacA-like family transporter [Xanthobacteraceae bacterium]|nr:SbmA/BacA-like family transporter [Xanthobacteraceae bacterium]